MREIKTKRFHLFNDGHLHIFDQRLANRLNRRFRRYLLDNTNLYHFKEGDEGKFFLSKDEVPVIIKLFLTKKDEEILTYTETPNL